MLPISQDRRDELVGEFWNSVRKRLIDNHHRRPRDADTGIGRYRLELENRGVGDTVYNQGVERTATIVDGLIDERLE